MLGYKEKANALVNPILGDQLTAYIKLLQQLLTSGYTTNL